MEREITIHRLARELAESRGYELVDVFLSPGARKATLRVLIHREGGVTLDDCRDFSESLAAVLDVENAMNRSYVLEVSSPGLTRALRTEADFRRNMDRQIEVFYSSGGKAVQASGRIVEASAAEFRLRTDAGDLVTVPYRDLTLAKPKIDWREEFRAGAKRTEPEEEK